MTTPTAPAPTHIAYLDAAAATPLGAAYKRRLLDLLDPRPGDTVLDAGCGPATDLPALAGAVGRDGSVTGVDDDPAMVAEARRRTARLPAVTVLRADVHDLPFPDACTDRARTDRVLQHVADPGAAIAEIARILRPGGLLAMAEPDWDTVAVADEDTAASRAFARYLATRVRNATAGRELARLCEAAGLGVATVEAVPVLLRTYEDAEKILGLERNAARAVAAGAMEEGRAAGWLARLRQGAFVGGFTLYAVVGMR